MKTYSSAQAAEAMGIKLGHLKAHLFFLRVEKPKLSRRKEKQHHGYQWTLTNIKDAAKALDKTKEFKQWNAKRIEDERCANIGIIIGV